MTLILKWLTFMFMRSLFFILLSCIVFTIPAKSKATHISVKLSSINQTEDPQLQPFSLDLEHYADLSSSSYLVNITAPDRYEPVVKCFIPTLYLINPYIYTIPVPCIEQYRYGTLIRLLIFPQHYFW
jgi:hypothetical protein